MIPGEKISDNYPNKMTKTSERLFKEKRFGLKCKVSITGESNTSVVYKTVRTYGSSRSTICINKEECMNPFRQFTCFRCFDGTIILKRQVCDGIIDCRDLSDECTCEKTKVSLCV